MGIVPYCKLMGNVNDQMLTLLTVLKKYFKHMFRPEAGNINSS